jgi:hypothetical protein
MRRTSRPRPRHVVAALQGVTTGFSGALFVELPLV